MNALSIFIIFIPYLLKANTVIDMQCKDYNNSIGIIKVGDRIRTYDLKKCISEDKIITSIHYEVNKLRTITTGDYYTHREEYNTCPGTTGCTADGKCDDLGIQWIVETKRTKVLDMYFDKTPPYDCTYNLDLSCFPFGTLGQTKCNIIWIGKIVENETMRNIVNVKDLIIETNQDYIYQDTELNKNLEFCVYEDQLLPQWQNKFSALNDGNGWIFNEYPVQKIGINYYKTEWYFYSDKFEICRGNLNNCENYTIIDGTYNDNCYDCNLYIYSKSIPCLLNGEIAILQEESEVYLYYCGNLIKDGERLCPEQQNNNNNYDNDNPYNYHPKDEVNKLTWKQIILIIIILLFIILFITMFLGLCIACAFMAFICIIKLI